MENLKKSLGDLIKSSRRTLGEIYPEREAQAIVTNLAREVLGVEPYAHVIDPQREILGDALAAFEEAVVRLRKSEPLQYVLGHADFCGHRFKVSSSVLIPRPETEMLCNEAVVYAKEHFLQDDSNFAGIKVLDLCCGSGCISWSLALALPGAEVIGADISEEALEVARSQAGMMQDSGQTLAEEARKKGANIPCFIKYDILQEAGQFVGRGVPDKFDIIVSNPPYVLESERKLMRRNVLDYEPDIALFVPDGDPLKFFQKISDYAKTRFNLGGFGIVEINEAFGEGVAAIFDEAGMSGIEIKKDFAGKMRFVCFKNSPSI